MVKDYSADRELTDLGCKRQLFESDVWYFWHHTNGLEDLGWSASASEKVFCGQVSYRSNKAIRLCETCLRRKGYLW